MTIATIWLTKLILSHFITDFILQPKSWVNERIESHFTSPKLYLHGLVTAILPLFLIGFHYWRIILIILIAHILIDGWKSYQKQNTLNFLIDQLLHLAVITICWYAVFLNWGDIMNAWDELNKNLSIWKMITGFVFITTPAGILIGQLTQKWRNELPEAENLANAGKWIGVIERIIILIFFLYGEYSAIGLLIATKGIIRFNEKDRPEIKTEYLVIGTLLSIGLAILTGIIIRF